MVRSTERYINSGYLTHSFFILTHTFKGSNSFFTNSNSEKTPNFNESVKNNPNCGGCRTLLIQVSDALVMSNGRIPVPVRPNGTATSGSMPPVSTVSSCFFP
ncbi:hypothetical protein Hanom_Chr04g00368411 [Helianthus anomalus]